MGMLALLFTCAIFSRPTMLIIGVLLVRNKASMLLWLGACILTAILHLNGWGQHLASAPYAKPTAIIMLIVSACVACYYYCRRSGAAMQHTKS